MAARRNREEDDDETKVPGPKNAKHITGRVFQRPKDAVVPETAGEHLKWKIGGKRAPREQG